jgi:(S)-mandelate dehydrogenase
MLKQRLQAIHDLQDFRAAARRRLPHMVFDFIDGAAGDESARRESRAALDRIRLVPSAPADVSVRSLRTRLFGQDLAMPVIIGPTGLASASWPKGERILAEAAARRGIPFVLSNSTSMLPEDVAAGLGGACWFQLYPPPDRATAIEWVERVQRCGYSALEVTVDVAVPGNRLRDARHGFALPFAWTPRKLFQVAMRPHWALQMARQGAPQPVLQVAAPVSGTARTVSDTRRHRLNSALSWDGLRWLRDAWGGPLIVKGLLDPRQAGHALAAGFDGIVISSHGGRQFDAAPAPIAMLPEFVSEVGGKLKLIVDGGIQSGADVLRALALGADAVQIGRAFVYALATAGAAGVDHALDILGRELDTGIALLGVTGVAELTADRVRMSGG